MNIYPIYRRSNTGNYVYMITAEREMLIVYNMIQTTHRIELTTNRFLIEDALSDEHTHSINEYDFMQRYDAALEQINNCINVNM